MQAAPPAKKKEPSRLRANFPVVASPLRLEEACFAAPALRAIRRGLPEATLVVICPQNLAAFWHTMPEIDQVLPYAPKTSPRALARTLQDCGLPFDLSLAFEDSPAAQAFARAAIPDRLGLPSPSLAKYLTQSLEITTKPGPIEHRVRHYLAVVEKLGFEAFSPANFTPPPRPRLPERPRVVLAPGSDFGPSAEWPLENYFPVLEHLLKGPAELHLLPSGSRTEPATALHKKFPQTILHRSDEMMESVFALLATADLLIGCDGTLPHLAAHLGTLTLSLFGPNEPNWKRPLGTQHITLRHHVPCSPCFLDKCPLDHRCLISLTPEEVIAQLGEEKKSY